MTVLNEEKCATTMDEGVYYARQDHPGMVVRILIDVVDVIVGLTLSVTTATFLKRVFPRIDAVATGLAIWVVYFTLLKWALGTPGYWVFKKRLVNLRGQRVGFWLLVARLAFMMAGPLNYLIDLLWMTSNGSRQAMRDQLLGTYVIRAGARPIGHGPIVWKNCYLASLAFVVGEVKRMSG